MFDPYLLTDGPTEAMHAGNAELLWILAAAFSPSIIAMLLMVFALWLPDEGYVPSQHLDARQRKPHPVNNDDEEHDADDDEDDWRRAA